MKRKIGLVIGYNGNGYHGLQHNQNVRTIEFEVINALLHIEAIKKENANDPKKIGLQRASRTDKGVHAAMTLLTCKIEIEITDDLFEKLKTYLSNNNIFLYKIIRLPGSFVPKKKCNQRFYEYVLPTFIFDKSFNKSSRIDNEDFNFINNLFQKYIGTKNFHNFTTTANTKGTIRYIKSIILSKPYITDDFEFINVKILGNSFMLHQIRKMIGFVITIYKYAKDKTNELFDKVYTELKWNIPKAPSEYLFLDHPCFDFYDKDTIYEKIYIDQVEIDEIKKDLIYPEIYKQENQLVFENWFEVFDKHFYEFTYLN
ncbi:tRNA pseudouridine synthase 1 [Conglomerata obtusa]